MFIHSLNLETIKYLCRFHMLKMLLWEVHLRLYRSHVFTAMCLQAVYSWKFEAPWRFVDWEYSEYAATRSWSGTVTTGWIGMERLDMVSAEYPFRSAGDEKKDIVIIFKSTEINILNGKGHYPFQLNRSV